MNQPQLTLILGGVSSGKSRFAESHVEAQSDTQLYIATAKPYDAEMQIKIAKHIARRGSNWHSIECPLDVAEALRQATHPVLIDCATLWLANVMEADRDITQETTKLLHAIADCEHSVTIVSNEVGLGGIADNPLARRFAQAQGDLNQQIAATADNVVFVAAGLPLIMKGNL